MKGHIWLCCVLCIVLSPLYKCVIEWGKNITLFKSKAQNEREGLCICYRRLTSIPSNTRHFCFLLNTIQSMFSQVQLVSFIPTNIFCLNFSHIQVHNFSLSFSLAQCNFYCCIAAGEKIPITALSIMNDDVDDASANHKSKEFVNI